MLPERYLRTGTAVPQIYPGTLENLQQAMEDATRASSRVPGPHCLYVQRGSEKYLLQVYEGGHCTWVREAGN